MKPDDTLQEIATFPGHLLVEAGAGAGKTEALVTRLLAEMGLSGASPELAMPVARIVAITFTRKAAAELRERLRRRILDRAAECTGLDRERWAAEAFALSSARIGTIDSFVAGLLREYGAVIGIDPDVRMADQSDPELALPALVEEMVSESVEACSGALDLVRFMGADGARAFILSALSDPGKIERLRSRVEAGDLGWKTLAESDGKALSATDLVLAPRSLAIARFLVAVHDRAFAACRRSGVFTFSYSLWAAYLISENPSARQAFRLSTRFMAVDEHQDTSRLQASIMFNLSGLSDDEPSVEQVRTLFVGDPKQGIYSFRNADITMWSRTARLVIKHGGKVVGMPRNYRSTPALISFFDELFTPLMSLAGRNRYECHYRPLLPVRGEGAQPSPVEFLYSGPGARDTSVAVARRIRYMLDHPEEFPVTERGPAGVVRPLRAADIAILSQELKFSGRAYASSLSALSVPSSLSSSRGIYDRAEVQDLVSALSAIADPLDTLSLAAFLRSPLCSVPDDVLAVLADGHKHSLWERVSSSMDPRVTRARDILLKYRALADRLPVAGLMTSLMDETLFRQFLSGHPDQSVLSAVDRLVEVAASSSVSLSVFAMSARALIDQAEREEEAPLYGSSDDKVTITTIHKAKGLEWPVVFVTGNERRFTQLTPPPAPLLSDRGGLALPFQILADDMTPLAPSVVWAAASDEHRKALYAEKRRVLYVACTRARDRLVMVFSPSRHDRLGRPEKAFTMDSAPDFMHLDSFDRWLRFIFPDLCSLPPVIRKGSASAVLVKDVPSPFLGGLAGSKWPDLGPAVVPTHVLPEEPSPIPASLLRRSFTATEIMQYDASPWRHFFGYRNSVSTTDLATSAAARSRLIDPAVRGTILHEFLRFAPDGVPAEDVMRSIILRHRNLASDELDEAVTRLLRHVERYRASPLAVRLAGAEEIYHEVPFVVRLDEHTHLEGVMDVVWRERGLWNVLDFKTAQFELPPSALVPVLDREVETYMAQAGVYALALSSRWGEGSLGDFHFLFTDSGESRAVAMVPAWIEKWRCRILEIVSKIRSGDYGPSPVFVPETCSSCQFLPVCRPAGMPG